MTNEELRDLKIEDTKSIFNNCNSLRTTPVISIDEGANALYVNGESGPLFDTIDYNLFYSPK